MGGSNVWILGGYQSDFARNLTREGRRLRRPDRRGRRRRRSHAARIDAADDRRRPRRQRVRRDVRRSGPPRRHARHRRRRPVGHPVVAPRGGLRVRAASRPSPRSPTCAPAPTTARWSSASSWRRPCPATPPPQHLGAAAWIGHEGARRHVHVAAACSPASPTSTTALRPRRRATCARSRSSTSPTPAATRTRRPATGRSPSPLDRRRRRQPRRRGPAPPLRLQPDDRRRRRRRAGHRRLPARPPRRAPDRRGSTAGATAPSGLGLQQKLDRSADDPYVLPHVRGAVLDAFGRAQVDARRPRRHRGARLLHPERVPRHRPHRPHRPGRILEGDRERRDRDRRAAADQPERRADRRRPSRRRDRACACSLDAAKQVSGTAGDYQVEGAKTFGTLNFGGSTATTVSFVVGSARRSRRWT